ncbi:hypothetical protein TanjilG_15116 [Lupinus angustifolius]|nr:hypothetical protein TanjilG_15116 [Lupinus angustifolius]
MIKWSIVCLPENQGGLGVRDLRLFKLTLSGTCKSGLLVEGDALWEKVVTSKYGNCNPFSTEVGNLRRNYKSRWWYDSHC